MHILDNSIYDLKTHMQTAYESLLHETIVLKYWVASFWQAFQGDYQSSHCILCWEREGRIGNLI